MEKMCENASNEMPKCAYFDNFVLQLFHKKIQSNVTQMNLSVCTRASTLSAKKMNLFESLNSSCSFKAFG